jgi:hypothetical protein
MIEDGNTQYLKGLEFINKYGKLQTFVDLLNKDLKS